MHVVLVIQRYCARCICSLHREKVWRSDNYTSLNTMTFKNDFWNNTVAECLTRVCFFVIKWNITGCDALVSLFLLKGLNLTLTSAIKNCPFFVSVSPNSQHYFSRMLSTHINKALKCTQHARSSWFVCKPCAHLAGYMARNPAYLLLILCLVVTLDYFPSCSSQSFLSFAPSQSLFVM